MSLAFAFDMPAASRFTPAEAGVSRFAARETELFEALSDEHAAEFAARLLDAETESEFDHLLGAIMTHAASRAGGVLPAPVGTELGRLLKRIARESRLDVVPGQTLGLELEGLNELEAEFEANLQFVRLAGEAARHAVEPPVAEPPERIALASLAAAGELYAPVLLSESSEAEQDLELAPRWTAFHTILRWNISSAG